MAPAIVSGTAEACCLMPGTPVGAQAAVPTKALVLVPICNLETSSRPMTLPPFAIRLPVSSDPANYPHFPAAD